MMITVKQHDQILYDINVLEEDLKNGLEVLIGREEDCHVQLDSYLISRYHAKISFEEGSGSLLEATSDYGGVYRNGAEIKNVSLIENDKITINDFELLITQLPAHGKQSQPQSDLPIDEAFSKTQIVERINDETVQIPAELEQMMEEDLSVAVGSELDSDLGGGESTDLYDTPVDADSEDLVRESEEEFSEMPFDKPDSENEFDDNLGNDLGDEDLAGNFEQSLEGDLSDDLSDSFESNDDNNLDSETEADFDNNFNNETQQDFDETNADDNFGDGGLGDSGLGDDGFGDDNFGDAGGFDDGGFGGGEDTGATQVFQSFAKFSLKIFGEYAPFDNYLIEEDEIKIGRDSQECQIALSDPEVSKVHAIIQKTKINCVLLDNDSSNGIIYNGERVKRAELVNGDEFVIGDTSFTVSVKSDIIEAERGALMPVPEGQEVEIEEIIEEEVDFDSLEGEGFGEEEEEKSFIKRIWKDKKKRMYLIIAILVLPLLLLDDSPPEPKVSKDKKEEKAEDKPKENTQYSQETREKLEQNYQLALARFGEDQFAEAKLYIDIVNAIDPAFSNADSLTKAIDEALAEQKRREEEKARAEEELKKQIQIKALVEKATQAVKERNVKLAESLFSQIARLDPENLDIQPLKLELDVWKANEQKKIEEAARKKALRQAMIDKMKPGKTAYIQENWYEASEKLEKFIKTPDIDEDLLKEASDMLKESRTKLVNMINPLVSKARSFKEGQDLKQAYETYGEVLKLDPTNEEALNERDAIFNELNNRSKKVYREALVAESLSLFSKAKEKFQEVQQISPINSEYYNKATDKLKSYLE